MVPASRPTGRARPERSARLERDGQGRPDDGVTGGRNEGDCWWRIDGRVLVPLSGPEANDQEEDAGEDKTQNDGKERRPCCGLG